MRSVFRILWVICALAVVPVAGWACIYPGPLMALNGTLIEIQNMDGRVSVHHRDRLRRGVDALSPDALRRTLAADVGRADLRAVDAVMAVSSELALGVGLVLDPAIRTHTTRLTEAVQTACPGQGQTEGVGDSASGLEHGTRQAGGTGRALTFREGLTRLSIAFTIYAIFLASVIALRRMQREAALDRTPKDAPAATSQNSPV